MQIYADVFIGDHAEATALMLDAYARLRFVDGDGQTVNLFFGGERGLRIAQAMADAYLEATREENTSE